jgi:uncharacterized linocin/CFP29 family protein
MKFESASSVLAMHMASGQFDPRHLRPYIDKDGQAKVAINGRGIVTNAPAQLRYDEWKDIDRRILEVTQQRLVGARDLISGGLTHSLGSIGNTISLWERESDITGANVDMSGLTEGEEDTANFDNVSVPVPIIHKDFRLNWRRLAASRLIGEGLDVTMADLAARQVAEATEDMLFAGSTIQVDGATIKGYTTHADRNPIDTAGNNWDEAGTTGAHIVAQVAAALAALRADGYHGPYVLYIPSDAEGKMDEDYNPATSDTRTIRQRVMALGVARIEVADRLATRNYLVVQLTRDVVDMAIAQDVTTVQWEAKGGMSQHFKVMAVWVPRVKSDFDGHCGIAHIYDVSP